MNKLSAIEIRDKFLKFFQDNDHLLIKDSSIIPQNDPTLLFINSGMAPLKHFFTGEEVPPCPRLCDIQPCIRTIDIDEVGDKHHLTSFQMLGSWSIGDYFKKEAISLAFKFLTNCLGIPKEKLYVTVFSGDEEIGLEEDSEAKKYWLEQGVEEGHIISCGKEDNFWGPTSETGPCGPCTEVFFDTGSGDLNKYVPGGDFDTKSRYIEIWNAGVFMQLNKLADGTFSKLKFKSVDTGAGLERLEMALNGYSSVYETSLLCPIKNFIKQSLSDPNKLSEKDILVITDHLRTAALILSEGVSPSNEGRGYIPRKLIRKCVKLAVRAKVHNLNFVDILKFILDNYSNIFPTFETNRDFVINEFEKEYEQFSKVLVSGLEKLAAIKEKHGVICAKDAFDLVTAHGLPFDIIFEFAKEQNIKVDEKGYKELLQKHRDISRNTKNGSNLVNKNIECLNHFKATEFVGYETLNCESKIIGILKGETLVNEASCNENVAVITEKTCFWAESGGQCSDEGYIYNGNFKLKVTDVQKKNNGVFVHIGTIEYGSVKINELATLEVNSEVRRCLANNHSAAHLLHSALKKVFGKEVNQAGSKVEKDKLRFDFNLDKKISDEDIIKIEELVNASIRDNLKCVVESKTLQEAKSDGAIALFDNKYSEKVRVVTFGDVSKELCAGTHTDNTGNIGLFIILNTEGIGKGMKRITAITGKEALKYLWEERALVKAISAKLQSKPDGVMDKICKLMQKKENSKENAAQREIKFDDAKVEKTNNGINFAVVTLDSFSKNTRDSAVNFADKIKGLVLCLTGEAQKQIVIAVSDKEIPNFSAGKILKDVLSMTGGKGGGNARVASGGGVSCDLEGVKNALLTVLK